MLKLSGKYPRLIFYLMLAISLAFASGAGRKWS
jgi:hypothetical protein